MTRSYRSPNTLMGGEVAKPFKLMSYDEVVIALKRLERIGYPIKIGTRGFGSLDILGRTKLTIESILCRGHADFVPRVAAYLVSVRLLVL